jgi:cellulose synthase/poly-beta-1,6-N-acetylglucosamine synthase-like glycosyltransferase
MPEISVTILVCTRNRPELLLRCLKSVCELDYKNFDLIVVDNASDNFTAPSLPYPCQTRFFSYPVPGLSRARNSVLSCVRGELLALLDDDAAAESEWLKNGTRPFEDPAVGCVTGRILPYELKTEWQRKILSNPYVPTWDDPREFDKHSFDPFTSVVGTGSNWMARMSFFEKNRFPEILGPGTPTFAADEHYMFYKIVQSGWRLRYEPSAVIHHEYPATFEGYNLRALRGGVSRGAYLTKFLISEKGYRWKAMKYLVRRSLPNEAKTAGAIGTSRRGLLRGPLALIRSSLQKKAPTEATLIAEFSPHAE